MKIQHKSDNFFCFSFSGKASSWGPEGIGKATSISKRAKCTKSSKDNSSIHAGSDASLSHPHGRSSVSSTLNITGRFNPTHYKMITVSVRSICFEIYILILCCGWVNNSLHISLDVIKISRIPVQIQNL